MSRQEEPLLEGDFADGAYGPTILLELKSPGAVSWFHTLLSDLAKAPPGTLVRLDELPRVAIGAAVLELNLIVSEHRSDRRLVRTPSGVFNWACTPDEWRDASDLVEPLLHQAGHQYLTSEVADDALVEVSYGEAHC